VRAAIHLPPKAILPLFHKDADDSTKTRLKEHSPLIRQLARLSEIAMTDRFQRGTVQFVVGEAAYGIPLAGIVDLDQESARLQKEIDKLSDEIGKYDRKFADKKFISKAPPAVVEEQRERRETAAAVRGKLASALAQIEAD